MAAAAAACTGSGTLKLQGLPKYGHSNNNNNNYGAIPRCHLFNSTSICSSVKYHSNVRYTGAHARSRIATYLRSVAPDSAGFPSSMSGAVCDDGDASNSFSVPMGGDITWAQIALQGPRSEMEDAIVIRLADADASLGGYSYAAVFDGHAGFSSVKYLREELYKECITASDNGRLLLNSSDMSTVENVLTKAFLQADNTLLSWLEETGEEIESGSTATVVFVRADSLLVAHVGDSRAVISRLGKPEVVGGDHRPYGKSKTSLEEIKRIRKAGAWINNGRVCGILSVSRAFGDIQLKTRRLEMLQAGVKAGQWTDKFAKRVEFNGDWVTAAPDIYQTNLKDCEFIILASDGLWDYIQTSEAVRFVRKELSEHGNSQRACEALANMALNRDGQDNVSVIIADFGLIQQQSRNGNMRFVEDSNITEEFGQLILILSVVGLGIWLSQSGLLF